MSSREMSVEEKITSLHDQFEVRQLLERYADCYTRQDWEGVTDCYVPEATFHELPPVELHQRNRKEIIEVSQNYMSSMKSVVMMIHSCVVEVDGNTAVAGTILHECGRTATDEDLHMFGRYEDRIVYRDGEWRFLERVFHPIQWSFPPSFMDLGDKLMAGLSSES